MEQTKKQKVAGVVRITLGTLWWTAVVLLALVIVNIFSAKIRGEVPSVFGYSVMNIVSGSMESPEDTDGGIPVGSYILIRRVDPKDIKRGDIICFYSTDPSIYGYPNTHRVVEEPIVTENGIEFVTKGDANPVPDKYNAEGGRLIGRFVRRLDGVTAFVKMLEGNGMLIMLGALGGAVVFMFAGAAIKARNSEDEE